MNMTERTCKCGCGLKFRCLETSGQRYFAKNHIIDFARRNARNSKNNSTKTKPISLGFNMKESGF